MSEAEVEAWLQQLLALAGRLKGSGTVSALHGRLKGSGTVSALHGRLKGSGTVSALHGSLKGSGTVSALHGSNGSLKEQHAWLRLGDVYSALLCMRQRHAGASH
jgi:hypothetical protein